MCNFIFLTSLLFMSFNKLAQANQMNCSAFINKYQGKLADHMPVQPITEFTLNICTNNDGKSCCTKEIEDKLKIISKNDYEKAVKKSLSPLSKMLKSKSSKFNDYFKDLLLKSKKDFHEMFKRTYGIVYEQNSYVFSDFFTELEAYFAHGKSNLADVMDTFFTILYQKMFIVMNGQYKFDEKYLVCVSEHMSELKPFGDVPQKLSLPLKRSFVAARTFSQSLNVAGDVVSNILNLTPSEGCLNAMTKMSHCGGCIGIVDEKICSNFCFNVMKACLPYHTEVDAEWTNFIDAMRKVEQRLLGPFNIELVVEPINVKISEAIMNFQENANMVSNKVFSECGKPSLKDGRRRRRQAAGFSPSLNFDENEGEEEEEEEQPQQRKHINHRKSEKHSTNKNRNNTKNKGKKKENKDYDVEEYSGSNNNNNNNNNNSPVHGFLKFIKEIGNQISSTKSFWKQLPYDICNEHIVIETSQNETCWNGTSLSRNDRDGSKSTQQNNPEIIKNNIDIKKPNSLLNEQLYGLKIITVQLRNAYNGIDVEFIDNDEFMDFGSGSGPSGPPSSSIGEDEDEDDREFGSGDGDHINNPILRIGNNNNNNDNDNDKTTLSHTQVSISTTSIPTTISISTDTSYISTTTMNNEINGNNSTTSGGGPSIYRYGGSTISLNKAIASYLLPTFAIWIGGSFNEWFDSVV